MRYRNSSYSYFSKTQNKMFDLRCAWFGAWVLGALRSPLHTLGNKPCFLSRSGERTENMTSPMDTNDTNTVAATLANQQYKMGRTLIDEGRLEEAVDFFSGLLEVRVKVLGDEMSPALAPLYYEYGNSLLYNAEESGAVFGDAITDAEKKRAMAIVEAAQSGDGKDGSDRDAMQQDGGDAGGGGGTGGALSGKGVETGASANPEAEDDLEIAWENLEMARRIYSTLEMSDDIKAAIAKVTN